MEKADGTSAVRLTKTVKKGGCAAKVPALVLREILKGVTFPTRPPELLVDGSKFDDAAIYRVSDQLALVQTLDFFTPVVDDPYLFGQIAAANSLSDVYAMGGTPKTCLAILSFPVATMAEEVVTRILQGASDKIAEADAAFVGGHSVDDETLKFGLSVTGYVSPKALWSNDRAKIGDVLILTKPLGTGTLLAGLKSESYSELDIQEALNSMVQLNRVIDVLSPELQAAIHAATDVTGFGLSGHGMQMALGSETSFDIFVPDLPLFGKTRESLEKNHLTKAHSSNRVYSESCDSSALGDIDRLVVCDPQTSGGLLLSVEESKADEVLRALRPQFGRAHAIGRVRSQTSHPIRYIR